MNRTVPTSNTWHLGLGNISEPRIPSPGWMTKRQRPWGSHFFAAAVVDQAQTQNNHTNSNERIHSLSTTLTVWKAMSWLLIEMTVCIVNGVASVCGCKKQKPLPNYSCSGGQCSYSPGQKQQSMARQQISAVEEQAPNKAMKVSTSREWEAK